MWTEDYLRVQNKPTELMSVYISNGGRNNLSPEEQRQRQILIKTPQVWVAYILLLTIIMMGQQ